jgi:hypothetical protein
MKWNYRKWKANYPRKNYSEVRHKKVIILTAKSSLPGTCHGDQLLGVSDW